LFQSDNQIQHSNELGLEQLMQIDNKMYETMGNDIIKELRISTGKSCIVVHALNQLFNDRDRNTPEGSGFLNIFRSMILKHLWVVFAVEYLLQKLYDEYTIKNLQIDDLKIVGYFEIFRCVYYILLTHDFIPNLDLYLSKTNTSNWQKIKSLLWRNSELDSVETTLKTFPKLAEGECAIVGKLVIYTLWEVYSQASDSIEDSVKDKALLHFLELALLDKDSSTLVDSRDVEETTIVDIGAILKSFSMVYTPDKTKQTEHFETIKAQLLQKNPMLTYMNIVHESNNQARCVYSGPRQVVELVKSSLEQTHQNINVSRSRTHSAGFRNNN